MSRTMDRLRRSRCQCIDAAFGPCPGLAVGAVWPPKRIGAPQQPSARACGRHLDEAQDRGWTVSRDAHAALMGGQG